MAEKVGAPTRRVDASTTDGASHRPPNDLPGDWDEGRRRRNEYKRVRHPGSPILQVMQDRITDLLG